MLVLPTRSLNSGLSFIEYTGFKNVFHELSRKIIESVGSTNMFQIFHISSNSTPLSNTLILYRTRSMNGGPTSVRTART